MCVDAVAPTCKTLRFAVCVNIIKNKNKSGRVEFPIETKKSGELRFLELNITCHDKGTLLVGCVPVGTKKNAFSSSTALILIS